MSLLRQVVRGSLVQVVVPTARIVEKLVEIPEIRAVGRDSAENCRCSASVPRQGVHSAAGGGGLAASGSSSRA